jgi:hypothetical protein
MPVEGPEIERLVRRLAECPADFLAEGTDAVAVVCDHLRAACTGDAPELSPELAKVRKAPKAVRELLPVVCWLLHDDWFFQRKGDASQRWQLFGSNELAKLVELIAPAACVTDPDRREELARLCLKSLGLLPKGETAAQAADRLAALDSVERHRVLKATAAAEKRAREVREAMAKQKAQESASRFGE